MTHAPLRIDINIPLTMSWPIVRDVVNFTRRVRCPVVLALMIEAIERSIGWRPAAD